MDVVQLPNRFCPFLCLKKTKVDDSSGCLTTAIPSWKTRSCWKPFKLKTNVPLIDSTGRSVLSITIIASFPFWVRFSFTIKLSIRCACAWIEKIVVNSTKIVNIIFFTALLLLLSAILTKICETWSLIFSCRLLNKMASLVREATRLHVGKYGSAFAR